jgi:hypothetical protein
MEADAGGCIVSIPLDAAGESFSFVTLEDGTLVIEDQEGEEPLESVAAVIERRTASPYRARGFRIDAQRWVVIADPLDLVDLGTLAAGDVTVVAVGGERRFVLDGAVRPETEIPAALLEELGDTEPCVISATNVDDEWWEITIEELPREVAATSAPPQSEPDDGESALEPDPGEE